ncbi:hypothetical protein BJV78DRAFT_1152622 [Lactifluus subvellereus]|nr:hypothetical protein BJV78DRAFT_1152622 [Lactifluus subvellereus]
MAPMRGGSALPDPSTVTLAFPLVTTTDGVIRRPIDTDLTSPSDSGGDPSCLTQAHNFVHHYCRFREADLLLELARDQDGKSTRNSSEQGTRPASLFTSGCKG